MPSITEIMLLCRLCSVKDEVNVPIFEEQGVVKDVSLKISACLPVKISKEDNLPKKICDDCLDKLESLYKFWSKSADTEKLFLTWLNQAGAQLTSDSFTIPELPDPDSAAIKEELIDDVSKITNETSIDKSAVDVQSSSIGYCRVEPSGATQIQNSTPDECVRESDAHEPIPKRRKTQDTFEAEQLHLQKVEGCKNACEINCEFASESTAEIRTEQRNECDNDIISLTDSTNFVSVNNDNDKLQPGSSGVVVANNDAPFRVIEQPDGNSFDEKCETKEQDDVNYKSKYDLKDYVVIVGDLEKVDTKKYKFVNRTLADLKLSLVCKLRCNSCDIDFNNSVSCINHQINNSKHLENIKKRKHSTVNETEVETSQEGTVVKPSENKYSCIFCDDCFDDQSAFKTHMSETHPFQCIRCCRVFMNVHQSILHTKMHIVKDRANISQKDKANAIQKRKQKETKSKEEKEKRLELVQGNKFEDAALLQLQNKNYGKYGCSECANRFEDCYQLQRHYVMSHHRMPEKRYDPVKLFKCVLCYKYFKSESLFESHMTEWHMVDVRSLAKDVDLKSNEPNTTKDVEERTVSNHDQMKSGADTTEHSDPLGLDDMEIICNDIEFETEDEPVSNPNNEHNPSISEEAEYQLPSLIPVSLNQSPNNSRSNKQTESPLPNLIPINLHQSPNNSRSILKSKLVDNLTTLMPEGRPVVTMSYTLSTAEKAKSILALDKNQQEFSPQIKKKFKYILPAKGSNNFTIQHIKKPRILRKTKKSTLNRGLLSAESSTSSVVLKGCDNVTATQDGGGIDTVGKGKDKKIKFTEITARSIKKRQQRKPTTKGKESGSCIDLTESDRINSDNKIVPDDDLSKSNTSEDVIEIDSSSDESNIDSGTKTADIVETDRDGSESPMKCRQACLICDKKYSSWNMTTENSISTCTWCNFTISVVVNKTELFDVSKSPLATGILSPLYANQFTTVFQCYSCKVFRKRDEFNDVCKLLLICNPCKRKISRVSFILVNVVSKVKSITGSDNKTTEDSRTCTVKCAICGVIKKIDDTTIFDSVIICGDCKPKLTEAATIVATVQMHLNPYVADANESLDNNLLIQIRCDVCTNLKTAEDVRVFSEKNLCSTCMSNIHKFALFFMNIMETIQKPCLTCDKLEVLKGVCPQGIHTYCSKCIKYRSQTCSVSSKSCGKSVVTVENKPSTEQSIFDAETSDEEDKLIIDLDSENINHGKNRTKPTSKQNNDGSKRESNASSSSSDILDIVEESKIPVEDLSTPGTSNSDAVPKIFVIVKPKVKTTKLTCGICNNKINQDSVTLYNGILACRRCKIKMEDFDCKLDDIKCFYCSQVFDTKLALTQHKDSVHLCHICSKYRENVADHLKKIIKCQLCQWIFCKKIPLGQHYREKHESRWCSICDMVLRDDYEVLLHRSSVHNQN